MTIRLLGYIRRLSLEKKFTEVAEEVGVNEKTVRNIFDEYVAVLAKGYQRETPIWLGIDEIKLKRFRAIFTNLHGRSLIDMLPNRYVSTGGCIECGRISALAAYHKRRAKLKDVPVQEPAVDAF